MMLKRIVGCFFSVAPLLAAMYGASLASAQEAPRGRENLKEPLLHIARKAERAPNAHPLDPALEIARYGREKIEKTIQDYTCTLVKRERVGGDLLDYEYIATKIRNPKVVNGKVVKPFAVYMCFLRPTKMKGREVIYVKGKNDDKLVAHEGGRFSGWMPTVWLKPTGMIAMRGQRYPIYDVGLRNLIDKLIDLGEQDKAAGRDDYKVTFREGAKINKRPCTLLEIKNPQPDPTRELNFSLAQVFIDDELQVPVRYAAYGFPAPGGEKAPLIEEYTYLQVELNVGLKDEDFDHKNKKYGFDD